MPEERNPNPEAEKAALLQKLTTEAEQQFQRSNLERAQVITYEVDQNDHRAETLDQQRVMDYLNNLDPRLLQLLQDQTLSPAIKKLLTQPFVINAHP